MKKLISILIIAGIFLGTSNAHAQIFVPYFNINIREHALGGDGALTFNVSQIDGDSPESFPIDDFTIDTTDGLGEYSLGSAIFGATTYRISQEVIPPWQSATIMCVSSNSLVTTEQIDNGILIHVQEEGSIDCDVTNTLLPIGGSSVIFLPGIKGSILKTGNDTLWPPTFFNFNDVSQMALTSSGESVNDVYVDGVVNKFHGTKIYEPFSDFLNSLVSSNTINDWLPLAYDWRFSPEKIIQDGVKTEVGVIDIINKIEQLAEHSKNGKVTIVAHSMGGLLGKAIIKKLAYEGKDNIIDSFIMVGSPQLGTPQAVASILHGDDEGILPLFIAHPVDMRSVAQNMPGAYNLLPSQSYFDKISDPEIVFDPNAKFTEVWRNFWGQNINSYVKFSEFVKGEGVPRTKPQESMLKDPEVLNQTLFRNAESFHREYDSYQFPEHIRVVQVAGWGSPTTKAINYKTEHGVPSYETIITREGDNTVVYPSAISSLADETYYFNLYSYRDSNNKIFKHRDLLNSDPIQDLISTILKKESVISNNYISTTKPKVDDLEDQLLVSTHSPVILGAYDQAGNFTGINQNQDLSTPILTISENIPGSTFMYTAEDQKIFLPKEGAYKFVYKGVASGSTTVTVDNLVADNTIPVVSYTDIPTTIKTSAIFNIVSNTPQSTMINLDTNSDGVSDKVIHADNAKLSLSEIFALIKEKISGLAIKDKLKQNLLKQIAKTEKKIERKIERHPRIEERLVTLANSVIKKLDKGKLSDIEANLLLNILYQIDIMI